MTNVGLKLAAPFDAVQQTRIPIALLYPTAAPTQPESFGPYTVDVARDAACTPGPRKLVVLSHGNGGSPWTLRGLGLRLAAEGFVVCLPEHIGNSRSDNSLEGTVANLENRPRHIRLAIDTALDDADLAAGLVGAPVGVIGMSIGGYSALAAAGGKPWCGPHESPDGKPAPVSVVHDERIRALVLMAPATPWFMAEGSLSDVVVPVLMFVGGQDAITPAWHGDLVRNGVGRPERVDFRRIANAGHFSFLSPFPAAMAGPHFAPSQDPAGFDRQSFQEELQTEVVRFLKANLASLLPTGP